MANVDNNRSVPNPLLAKTPSLPSGDSTSAQILSRIKEGAKAAKVETVQKQGNEALQNLLAEDQLEAAGKTPEGAVPHSARPVLVPTTSKDKKAEAKAKGKPQQAGPKLQAYIGNKRKPNKGGRAGQPGQGKPNQVSDPQGLEFQARRATDMFQADVLPNQVERYVPLDQNGQPVTGKKAQQQTTQPYTFAQLKERSLPKMPGPLSPATQGGPAPQNAAQLRSGIELSKRNAKEQELRNGSPVVGRSAIQAKLEKLGLINVSTMEKPSTGSAAAQVMSKVENQASTLGNVAARQGAIASMMARSRNNAPVAGNLPGSVGGTQAQPNVPSPAAPAAAEAKVSNVITMPMPVAAETDSVQMSASDAASRGPVLGFTPKKSTARPATAAA